MSVEKIQRDITNLFNYPSDPNPTTQQDYIAAVKNWVETIVNLVDCNLWQPETNYSVGNYLRTPSLPSQVVLRCVTAGISGTEEPDYTDAEIGDTIADGSIEWTIQTMASLNELDAYFAEIIQRIENGEGVVDTMWETDLETDIQPISATNVVPKVNGTGTLGTSLKKWANVYTNGLTVSGTATAENLSVSGTATVVTPTSHDDSNKVATTKYVQAELEDYLALTGGTITGNLTVTGNITGNLNGNADTATNATNDGNGNQIDTTYLPLAGGTMTGVIKSSVETILARNSNDENILIAGGSSWSNGAYLSLCGKDRTGGLSGQFSLYAKDGVAANALTGKPNGTLTWGGNNVLTNATVGTIVSKSISSSVSLSANTAKTITSISLVAGVWVIAGYACYTSNTPSRVYCAGITTTANSFALADEGSAAIHASFAGGLTVNVTRILKLSATTTVYLCGYSSNAATVSNAHIKAVRIV